MRDAGCTRCPLHEGVRSRCIEAEGPLTARVLFLGEAPGADEDEECRPFVGKAGRKLREYLATLGVEFRVTNSARCRPPGNRKPKKEELDACSVFLISDLNEMPNLEVIVALGETPMRALGIRDPVLETAGNWRTTARHRAKVFVIAHPSYIGYNPPYEANWKAHWDILRNALQPKPDFASAIGAEILDHVEIPDSGLGPCLGP